MRRTVKKILDGDTFIVNRKVNGSNKIRLSNVNAPERGRRGASTATNTLRGLVGGKTITLQPKARSYDRIVADVRVNRRSVNKRMRDKGY
ncbi:thermonuclease family protein [Bacteroidota bacterium]